MTSTASTITKDTLARYWMLMRKESMCGRTSLGVSVSDCPYAWYVLYNADISAHRSVGQLRVVSYQEGSAWVSRVDLSPVFAFSQGRRVRNKIWDDLRRLFYPETLPERLVQVPDASECLFAPDIPRPASEVVNCPVL